MFPVELGTFFRLTILMQARSGSDFQRCCRRSLILHRTYAQTPSRCQCARRVSACVILFYVLYVSRADAHFVDALCVFARDGVFFYAIFAPSGAVFLNDAL